MFSLENKFKDITHQVLSHPLLREKPPVLIDIGASGKIHPAWSDLAKYSICIAFDADERDFNISSYSDRGYKSLFLVNRVVTSSIKDNSEFYLTSSPHCSSILMPDLKSLEQWAFYYLFCVSKRTTLPTLTLVESLSQCGADYIDLYKSDSQGTDLRLFDSLPNSIKKQIIAAEFEPGILDSYIGEDKLHTVMKYMDDLPFWVSDMCLKGSHRINYKYFSRMNSFKKRFINFFLRSPPGWCEITYLNNLDLSTSERDLLLAWLIASIKAEHGFALSIARQGMSVYGNSLFHVMSNYSYKCLDLPSSYLKILYFVIKRSLQKLI